MKSENGQTLAIIVMIVLVVLTVGLTVATRSLTGLRETTRQEESVRAYDAAEAGIEQALQRVKDGAGSGTIGNGTLTESGSVYNYNIESMEGLSGNQFSFRVEKDQAYQINLDGINQGTNVNIYWWKQNSSLDPSQVDPNITCASLDPAIAALEFSYMKQDGSGYSIAKKEIFDPCATTRLNNLSLPYNANFIDTPGSTFRYKASPDNATASMTLQNDTKRILRITPRYYGTWVIIETPTGTNIPSQGLVITSTGTSGESKRSIKVSRSVNALPAIFDFSIFSGSDQPLQK